MRVPATIVVGRQGGYLTSRRASGTGWNDEVEEMNMTQTFDWQGAMEMSQRMLSTDPDHLGALETLAQAQWFGGQFNEVISTTSRLLRLNPSEPGYRYTRGMAHLSKGELALASEDFRTAIAFSNNTAFREQVASSLHALERWMVECPVRPSRFGASPTSTLGLLN